MKKSILFLVVSLFFMLGADLTHQDGYRDGYVDGENKQLKHKKALSKKETDSKDYNEGYEKGYAEGYKDTLNAQGAKKCKIPGYLRTKDCEAKNVLFSWKLVLPSTAVALSLPDGTSLSSVVNGTDLDKILKQGSVVGASVNIGASVQFGAYYRLWKNLVLGGNAGIGAGAIGYGYALHNNNAPDGIEQKFFYNTNIYVPVEALVKYYFNAASFSVGLGIGGDISFSGYHTFRTFAEFGWPGFGLRLGWQHQGGVEGSKNPATEAFYSAFVFGY